jgi:hypothetical protein
MSELSPVTSAILDAYWETFNAPLEGAVHRPLAAALRVAADQLMERTPRVDVGIGWPCNELHAIAAELEAQ